MLVVMEETYIQIVPWDLTVASAPTANVCFAVLAFKMFSWSLDTR